MATSKRRVIIADQFNDVLPRPYQLREQPMTFDALVDLAQQTAATRDSNWLRRYGVEITEVDETYVPRMATTVYAADEDGNAFVWKAKWDSSG